MTISFKNISHEYDNILALSNLNLEVKDGEIVCILGPSGSGKSTLLRIAAGLEVIQNGEIHLDDQLLANNNTNPSPEDRPIGLVFQDHALFPHLTVAENISFGLVGPNNIKKTAIVKKHLASVDLSEIGDRYPHTLSGGQQQRVALIRALATEPSVILLDEPFASVDIPLRKILREQARYALKDAKTATLMVTHDPEEAMEMADRILILDNGNTVQIGKPETLWCSPKSPYVAQTFAGMQTINGKISGKYVETSFGKIPFEKINNPFGQSDLSKLKECKDFREGQQVYLSIRSSSLKICESKGPATIKDKRFLGRNFLTTVNFGDEQIYISSTQPEDLALGALVDINFASAETLIYSR
ncbi:MAG: ABC transporter [Gammaproteobacteria bacterium]|nr:ABC transporter [Gammaproteobacteria bacterium]|tara:strand:+ start:1868 stop:2941 length:1074 start_codon:yes stop_codon:yes gene_type:complete